VVVNDSASRTIDQQGCRHHQREITCPDQTTRLFC
jgi:hypothetical protein